MAILLQITTTRIVVNDIPERRFAHAGGLCQGDPISLLLFVIAMDALTAIISKAMVEDVLTSYSGIQATQRLSIYADDVALFLCPTVNDLSFVRCVLSTFGEATGLRVNYRKSSAILIRGGQGDRAWVEELL